MSFIEHNYFGKADKIYYKKEAQEVDVQSNRWSVMHLMIKTILTNLTKI